MRQRAAAELRRYAMKHRMLLPHLVVGCLTLMPQLSHAQACDVWQRFAEPSAETDVIEVLSSGGYGPQAGRTLVSVDAAGRIALLGRGQCPDRTLVGHLETPTFEELGEELQRAIESVRGQPPRPVVSAEHSAIEIIREGRIEPLCQSPADGVDVDVTLYRRGSKEHYRCVTGALLRFGDRVLDLIADALCGTRMTAACIDRLILP